MPATPARGLAQTPTARSIPNTRNKAPPTRTLCPTPGHAAIGGLMGSAAGRSRLAGLFDVPNADWLKVTVGLVFLFLPSW